MPGTSEAIRLIELTAARLCQDIPNLPGPAPEGVDHGVGGTHEAALRQLTQQGHGKLLGQTPDHRLWRSKLLRAAWGPEESPLPYEEILLLAAGLPEGVIIEPSGLDAGCVFPPHTGRIVLNLLLLAAESLPSGGTVMLAGSADDLFLRIVGPACAWPAGMAACMVDEAAACAEMTGDSGAQMPLTTLLAHASGIRLSFLLTSSSQTTPPILRLGGA